MYSPVSPPRSPAAPRWQLVPLLSRVFAGDRTIVMPWPGPLPLEGALLGLRDILAMLADSRVMSFLIYQARQLYPAGQVVDVPGSLITFRPGAPSHRHVLYKNFLKESVCPLLEDGKVLLGTEVGIVSFAGAFLIGPMDGQE
jgi:hypothetical protein